VWTRIFFVSLGLIAITRLWCRKKKEHILCKHIKKIKWRKSK
jgi:hypothetical protein